MFYKKYLLSLVLCFPAFIYSQTNDSLLTRITEQLSKYTILHNSPGLYLHVDKSIYIPNEHIWFTSYFVNPVDITLYHTLYVLMVDKLTKKIVANDRFIISNGIGKGQILMQDSLPAGEYMLIAYTNALLDNINAPVYQQSISLRSSYKANWIMTAHAGNNSLDSLSIVARVVSSGYVFAIGGKFNYTLYGNDKPLYTDTKIIDRFGEVHIPYSSKDASLKLELAAKVFYKDDTILLRQPVEITRVRVKMKFYPEGGNLVDGHLSKVAFEIFTSHGKAIATTGTLLQNGNPVTTFLSNQHGQGTFNIKPKAGKQYTVVLDEQNPHVLHADFPSVELSGYTIAIKTPVIDDVLKVSIQAPTTNSNCIVLLHNYQKQFFSAHLFIKRLTGLLNIPIKDLPPGVATLTVLNDQGIAVAERAVLIKNKKHINVSMNVDSAIYNKRGKVQLKIKLTDENNQPKLASFSLACVLANRLDTTRFIDINRYQIFDQFLLDAGVLPALSYLDNETNIDLVLLTRFWTRYNWNKVKDIFKSHKLTGSYGYVLYRNKPLKKPVGLMLLGTNSADEIVTDSAGKFQLPSNKLNGTADSKFLLSVNDSKNQSDYKIVLENDIDSFNISLAGKPYNSMTLEKDELPAEEKKGNKNVLATVVVTSRNIASENAIPFHSKNCNDYVCIYNILNCQNHPEGGMSPVNGNTYLYRERGASALSTIIYKGCNQQAEQLNQGIKQVKATYFQKEFYVADYSKFNPAEEEINTTIYWSHQIITDKNGEAIISFYTNDLAGRFICVLEGLSEMGPVSSKIKFEVNKN